MEYSQHVVPGEVKNDFKTHIETHKKFECEVEDKSMKIRTEKEITKKEKQCIPYTCHYFSFNKALKSLGHICDFRLRLYPVELIILKR